MAAFSFHRLIMGKSENLLFLQSHWRFCRNVYLVVLYVMGADPVRVGVRVGVASFRRDFF